jgi:hypothetical protein
VGAGSFERGVKRGFRLSAGARQRYSTVRVLLCKKVSGMGLARWGKDEYDKDVLI